MKKPESIKILEDTYGFKLKNVKSSAFESYIYESSYELDNGGDVTSLNLRNEKIGDISFIQRFPKLRKLELSKNGIKNHSALRYLSNLTNLNLAETKLSDITFLPDLSNLEYLDLSDNLITDISALENLPKLKTLILSRNNITDFSPLSKLLSLKSLDLWTCSLDNLESIAPLKQLERLRVWENNIKDIEILKDFANLRHLDIGKNPIIDFSPLSELVNLESLEVDNCNLHSITFLESLTSLVKLNLSQNNLIQLNSLVSLSQLFHLNLRNNNITDILPLEHLINLETLILAENDVNDLRPIKKIIASGVRLSADSEFDDNACINIFDNFTTIPPLEVIHTENSVDQYFEDAQEYGIKPLNECKIILLGDGELGKTSMMKQIVGLPFSHEPTTHGINKKSWHGVTNGAGEEIKVNLWDFGGQHIQHSLHQFFLNENVIYILLLNPRNDTNALYWLEQINKLGKNSELIIVYNWKDIKDKESYSGKNFYELRKIYPTLHEPFLLSCKTGEGFDTFKHHLIKLILKKRDLFVQYPLNWFSIKDDLETDVTVNKNYILYREYDEICKVHHYENFQSKKNLLRQLNEIGSIVFFDKPILNDLQVLNPDWITTGAYSVLTAELTNEKKGHLKYSDLLEIFKEEKSLFANEEIKLKYHEKDFLFILALMTDYDICVENPFAEKEYLIPCAFEGEKPAEFEEYKRDATRYRIRFDSSFEMLIMYRFMARNISRCVADNGYWQSGIVLKAVNSNTFAMVETNQYSKIIDFWIKGSSIRALWEVLRHDIKDINQKYGLEYEEEILYKIEKGKEIFLSYDELINSLKNGVRVIEYHPIHKIFNIDVLNVLENFEDSKEIVKNMKNDKSNITVKGNLINNASMQVGGTNNVQTSYINNYSSNDQIELVKDILEELEDLSNSNEEWQNHFSNALKELYRLQDAKDEIEQKKSEGKLRKFFQKAKDLKDIVAIGVLPAEISVKGGKMLELAAQIWPF